VTAQGTPTVTSSRTAACPGVLAPTRPSDALDCLPRSSPPCRSKLPPVGMITIIIIIHAPPITAVGLRLSDEAIRVAVAHRIVCKTCEPHTCACGKAVDARGLHGLSCRRSAPRQQRHSHLNDILWRAIKRAQMPAVKEPVSLMRDDNKHPNGTTLLPWARGKPMAWNVSVPDTYVESHIGSTATKPGAAGLKTTQNKIDNYAKLMASTHTHLPWRQLVHGTTWSLN